ncbi:membrane-associated protein, putative [Bodo saltans]|uniref:Membrane-associated protein, putative n=1 Tax=Bodo saltans TaxID=75058 RepID=A0A0S4JDT5_BODSA|nr:membrane-associated protein, putative [Bodo saltans]|eukprot:CUG87149.1 membrane-associated protein, putative [Bodo saltans]
MAALLLTVVVNLQLLLFSSSSWALYGFEIPCDSSKYSNLNPFEITSHQSYTLTNCKYRSSEITQGTSSPPPPFVYLMINKSLTTLESIRVDVVGGDVIPLLLFSEYSAVNEMKKILIRLNGVRLLNYIENRSSDAPSLSIISTNVQRISNISMIVTNSTVDITTVTSNATYKGAASSVIVLLLNVNPQIGYEFSANIVNVTIQSSNISVRVEGTSPSNIVAFVRISAGSRASIDQVAFHVVGSAMKLIVNATLVVVDYRPIAPAFFSIRCSFWEPCFVSRITFVAERATIPAAVGESDVLTSVGDGGELVPFGELTTTHLVLDQTVPGTFSNRSGGDEGTDDTAALVFVNNFLNASAISIVIHQNTTVFVGCNCGQRCDSALDSGKASVRARVADISGRTQTQSTSAITRILFNMTDAHLVVTAPKTALGITVDTFISLEGLIVLFERCVIAFQSTNLNIGQGTRNQAFLEVSAADNTTGLNVLIRDVTGVFDVENGGCFIVISTAVNLLGNISRATIVLTRVKLTVNAVLGTAAVLQPFFDQPSFTVTALTTGASLINVAPHDPNYGLDGAELNLYITNSSLDATHTTDLPAVFLALIVSIIAVVNAARSLENCTVTLTNTHVVRHFSYSAGPASWMRGTDVHFNTTALVNLINIAAVVAATSSLASAFAPLLGGGSYHTNISTSIVANCTVSYDEALVPSSSDSVSFINLPTMSNRSTYMISNSWPSRAKTFGAPIGCIGGAQLLGNSRITVEHMSGVSMLLFVFLQPFEAQVGSQIIFDNISATARDFQLRMNKFTIGSETWNGPKAKLKIGVLQHSTTSTQPPVLLIQRCSFHNFASLIMAEAVDNESSSLPDVTKPFVFLDLGCNLWDGAPLLPSAIGLDLSSPNRPIVNYRGGSSYNENLKCRGFFSDTNSITRSVDLPVVIVQPPPPPIPPAVMTTVTTVVGVVGAAAAASGAMFDAQGLIALGRSSCAPPILRAATAASQFLLSPFYFLGDKAMVFGNIAVFVLIHGVHRLLLRRYKSKEEHQQTLNLFQVDSVGPLPSTDATKGQTSIKCLTAEEEESLIDFNSETLTPPFSHHHATLAPIPPTTTSSLPAAVATLQLHQKVGIQLRAEVALRFPNHSVAIGLLLAPGVANGGTRELFSGTIPGTISGVVALLVVAAGVWWRVTCGRSMVVGRFRFTAYRRGARQRAAAPWALPLGIWGPPSLRFTHGRLRGSVRLGGEWLSALPVTVSLLIQSISSIPVPTSWCVGMWGALSFIQLAAATMTALFRPSRAPLSDVLLVLGLVAAAGIQIVAGLIAAGVEDLLSLLSALSLVTMIVSLLKMIHTVYMALWERKQQHLVAPRDEEEGIHDVSGRDHLLPLSVVHQQQHLRGRNDVKAGNENSAASASEAFYFDSTHIPSFFLRSSQEEDVMLRAPPSKMDVDEALRCLIAGACAKVRRRKII